MRESKDRRGFPPRPGGVPVGPSGFYKSNRDYSRTGGYEDVNDGEGLLQDRTFRLIRSPSQTPIFHPKLRETPQDPSTGGIAAQARTSEAWGVPLLPRPPLLQHM